MPRNFALNCQLLARLLVIRLSSCWPRSSPPFRSEPKKWHPARANGVIIFGPETFARDLSSSLCETRTFTAPGMGREYRLRVQNGKNHGLEYLLCRLLGRFSTRNETGVRLVRKGRILINGEEVLSEIELRQAGTGLTEKIIALTESNTLIVEIKSLGSSGFTVEVLGFDQ